MLFTAILAGSAILQTDARMIRLETLSNGARVFVQRMPEASQCSVQLWLSASGLSESPSTHGHRHLLEHLMAIGPTADLDRRLEAKGLMLLASTSRDATTFKVDCPNEQLDFVVSGMSDVLRPLSVSEEIVQREAKIILHELAVRPNSGRASAAVWGSLFGEASLDPAGDPKVLKSATLAELRDLQQILVSPKRVLLVICGPVDADKAIQAGKSLLSGLPTSGPKPPRNAEAGKFSVPDFVGSAVGVRTEGLPDKNTLAKIGVAMAIAQKLGEPIVSYTPSVRPGVVVMSSTQKGLLERIKGLQAGYVANAGINVFRWLRGLKSTPSGMTGLRGALLCGESAVNVEQVEAAIGEIGTSEILGALHEFQQAQEVRP